MKSEDLIREQQSKLEDLQDGDTQGPHPSDVFSNEDDSDEDSHSGYGAGFRDEDSADDLIDLDAIKPTAAPKSQQVTSSKSNAVKLEDEDEPLLQWESKAQLVSFRNQSAAIADKYLKQKTGEDGKPLKLLKAKKRPALNIRNKMDDAACKKESKDINVKRKRITQAGEV